MGKVSALHGVTAKCVSSNMIGFLTLAYTKSNLKLIELKKKLFGNPPICATYRLDCTVMKDNSGKKACHLLF